MTLPTPTRPDALRPTAEACLAAWTERCRADRDQVERCREVEDPADFYAPVVERFRADPRRTDEPVLDALLVLAREGETWLDIGAGAGRYALPLALRVGRVVAVEPSAAMVETLLAGAAASEIHGIAVVAGRWPACAEQAGPADAALMAHVGYDIATVGPFLDAAEAAASRLCVAVMGEGAMTTAATLFWEPVHGEPRVALPALPELLALLVARGHLPEVTLAPRRPPAFETLDDLVAIARRQLWTRPGSARDERLRELVTATATQRAQGWALDWRPTRIGVVTWAPRSVSPPGPPARG